MTLSIATSRIMRNPLARIHHYFSATNMPWTKARNFSIAGADSSGGQRVETNVNAQGICHVILNRPDKLNALDLSMFEAIAKTATDLQKDPSIRAVILRGNGRAWCTGLDFKSVTKNPQKITKRLMERPSGYGGVEGQEISNLAQDVAVLWRQLPVPVIAVLHGMCYGGGLQIALGADMRYTTPDCKFCIMEGKWGLIPDMGASITLRELVRIDVAKELTMTGRIFLGDEAADLGLVTKSCQDPLAYAEQVAMELIERSPDAVASAKRLYQQTRVASEEECLQIESTLQTKLLSSWNQLAASGRAFGWNVPYFNRKQDK
jgi:enoyl-CoA hydratase/carnithine racemase